MENFYCSVNFEIVCWIVYPRAEIIFIQFPEYLTPCPSCFEGFCWEIVSYVLHEFLSDLFHDFLFDGFLGMSLGSLVLFIIGLLK
jgi:hypothetical protein